MSRGDITENLSRSEFECRDGCGLFAPHPVQVYCLQKLRSLANVELVITGPGRCANHNREVGGSEHSFHLPQPITGYTMAVDGYLKGIPLHKQYLLTKSIPEFDHGGIGVYVDDKKGCWLHWDVRRDGAARWCSLNGDKNVDFQQVWDKARQLEQDPNSPFYLG